MNHRNVSYRITENVEISRNDLLSDSDLQEYDEKERTFEVSIMHNTSI